MEKNNKKTVYKALKVARSERKKQIEKKQNRSR